MDRRPLGKTGLDVTLLGFGTSEIGFFRTPIEEVGRILNEALDAGLRLIDTAECYLDSEEKIGLTVSHRRSEFVLASKLGHSFAGGPELEDWDRELCRLSIDNSLRQLKTEVIDLMQVHSCSAEVLGRGEVIEVLQHAQAQGKIRFLGYSGDGADAVAAIESGVFDVLQTSCSVADQESIDLLLPKAQARQMGVIIKRPVANVAWINGDQPPERAYARTYWERLRVLQFDFLNSAPQDIFATALRFTASQPGVSSMIVGSQRPGRWLENARILEAGPLPEAEIARIRSRWQEVAPPDWVGQT